MLTVYGIKNCDTCRKTLKWLNEQGIDHVFHDFRVDGLEPALLRAWIGAMGWEALLNKRSTTWRRLGLATSEKLDAAQAADLMMANPTLIKRPVFAIAATIVVGFGTAQQRQLLADV
jgi:Spx/MgsR family transcriptional regulator